MSKQRWVRIGSQERAELWRRWQAGETLTAIAEALGRGLSSVQDVLRRTGGIAPAVRHRSTRELTQSEREDISRGLSMGWSLTRIAEQLQRAPSTISREVKRNGGRCGYRAVQAERAAWQRARRPKACLLARHPALRQVVADKLQRKWSPAQIAGWLEVAFADDDTMRVSPETIYRSLFIQTRGLLKKQLLGELRRAGMVRRPKHTQGLRPGQITDALSIRERPAEAADRAVPGHWEGDLLCGGQQTQIATLVERRSRFVMLVKLKRKDTDTVVGELTRHIQALPAQLRQSLTWDRGLELASHRQLSLATDMQVYFCDPRSPWQRGTNENTNGLLRQYFPKGTTLSGYTQADLDAVALELNQRPRQTLGFRAPADILYASIAATG